MVIFTTTDKVISEKFQGTQYKVYFTIKHFVNKVSRDVI